MIKIKRPIILLFLWLIVNTGLLLLHSFLGTTWSFFLFKLCGGYDCATVLSGIALDLVLKNKKRPEGYMLLLLGLVYTAIFQSIMYALVLIGVVFIVWIVECVKIPFMSNCVLSWLAAISYSVYVSHQNIGFVLINGFVKLFGNYESYMSVFAILVVIILGSVIYYLVEKPMQIVVKRICA